VCRVASENVVAACICVFVSMCVFVRVFIYACLYSRGDSPNGAQRHLNHVGVEPEGSCDVDDGGDIGIEDNNGVGVALVW
jgi:hypothetical protein